MKRPFPSTITLLLVLSLFASGCVVTAPVKVATTGAKVSYKTAKAGTKTAVGVGKAVIPDGEKHKKTEEPD